jgi:putative transposase
MVAYRRSRLPGGTYFFTVALLDRSSTALVDGIDDLRAAFRATLRRRPFSIDALVVLPDHLHALWTLPAGDTDYSTRWAAIKTHFSRAWALRHPVSRTKAGEYRLWQRRFWEHTIRDDRDYAAHVDYIHINPVKHGWASRVADWPHSSFHRYVARGIFPPGWAGTHSDDGSAEFGEPT